MRSWSVGPIVKHKNTIEASFSSLLPAVLLSRLHSLLIYYVLLSSLTFTWAHDFMFFYDGLFNDYIMMFLFTHGCPLLQLCLVL